MKLSTNLIHAALSVLVKHDVTYASQFASLLADRNALRLEPGKRYHQQGLGRIGGGIAAKLRKQGLIDGVGGGDRYTLTRAGRDWLFSNFPEMDA